MFDPRLLQSFGLRLRGPMTIFQDIPLTRTYRDDAGDYGVHNVLSPRDLVFRPDLWTKSVHTHTCKKLPYLHIHVYVLSLSFSEGVG